MGRRRSPRSIGATLRLRAPTMRRENATLLAMLLPAGAFFGAFFLLPLARLFLVGGSGRDGFITYATIITDRNHFASLTATLALAAATTGVTLIVSGLAG